MKKKTFFIHLAAWAAFLVATVVGTLWGLNAYTRHGDAVRVPDLKGQSEAQAQLKLTRLGLQAEVSDSGYVRSLPAGTVLGQSIAAGEQVKPGRIIYLTINSGNSPTVVLPDIADNSSLREAQSRLLSLGFKLSRVEYTDGDKDWVYDVKVRGRMVPAGTRVPIDVPITLVVGNGNVDDTYNGADTIFDFLDAYSDSLYDNFDEPPAE